MTEREQLERKVTELNERLFGKPLRLGGTDDRYELTLGGETDEGEDRHILNSGLPYADMYAYLDGISDGLALSVYEVHAVAERLAKK